MEESRRYRCENRTRADLLRDMAAPVVNGIDYLEVLDREAPPGIGEIGNTLEERILSVRQRTLLVRLFKPLDDPALLVDGTVVVIGGVSVPVRVEWFFMADQLGTQPPGQLSPEEILYFSALTGKDSLLIVRTDSDGDFSAYTLRVQVPGKVPVPLAGFDPVLFEVHFSFKVECPSDFDCEPAQKCVDEVPSTPNIDYLAKDYLSFRQLMLDRMSVTNPQWKERHVPDLQLSLVELLAYAADRLSYFQDAVATEAYLSTARRRSSVRRHARLLNYPMHDGCNARAWLHLHVKDADQVDLSTGVEPFHLSTAPVRFLSQVPGKDNGLVPSSELSRILNDHPDTTVFELQVGGTLHRSLNELRIHTWGAEECCLPQGATWADLVGGEELDHLLGRFLLFEEMEGTADDDQPDPSHRQVVRIIDIDDPVIDPLYGNTKTRRVHWDDKDKLAFPLCVTCARISGNVSVARGNIVLADHGYTLDREHLPERDTGNQRPYRPSLDERGITFWQRPDELTAAEVALLDDDERKEYWRSRPAIGMLRQDARKALAAVELLGDGRIWQSRCDLLKSDRFDTHFVAETESDGIVHLRFGDGIYGLAPDGDIFSEDAAATDVRGALYRIGNGAAANLGAESLTHIVGDGLAIDRVYQPLPAAGGLTPESLEEVRQYAPQAFRLQERAVTTDDYAEKTQQYPSNAYPDVQRAAAIRRWTGSWYTMFVTADRFDAQPVDSGFEDSLRDHLEGYRLTGHDLEVNAPSFVALEIRMGVCVEEGFFASDVKQQLFEVFSSGTNTAGEKGFFHPDNFTFGQPVYLSKVIAAAMGVDGVKWVELSADDPHHRFQRWRQTASDEITEGRIAMGRLEIAQLDNDPSLPENGTIDFLMH